MKTSLSTIERRISAIEQRPDAGPLPLAELRLSFTHSDGSKTTEWETTRRVVNGVEGVFHQPIVPPGAFGENHHA